MKKPEFTAAQLRDIEEIEQLQVPASTVNKAIGKVSHREKGTYEGSRAPTAITDYYDATRCQYERPVHTTFFDVVDDQLGKDLKEFAGGWRMKKTVGKLLTRVFNCVQKRTGEPYYSEADRGLGASHIRAMVERMGSSEANLPKLELAIRKYEYMAYCNEQNPTPVSSRSRGCVIS